MDGNTVVCKFASCAGVYDQCTVGVVQLETVVVVSVVVSDVTWPGPGGAGLPSVIGNM